jgi:hypothetical protein
MFLESRYASLHGRNFALDDWQRSDRRYSNLPRVMVHTASFEAQQSLLSF